MDWKKLHDESLIFDWHNHGTLKNFLFDRSLDGKSSRPLTSLFKRSFWPLSERNTLPKMEEGGLDVVLSTSYIPEIEWVDDQSLIKVLKFLFPKVRKRVFDPTYFDAVNAMMDSMEAEVEKYEASKDREGGFKFVKSVEELEKSIDEGYISMIHSVEGAHSLNGKKAKKRVEDYTARPEVLEKELLKNLEHFYNRGVAYLTLAHFYENHVASPVFPYPEYGIKGSNWKQLLAGWDMNKGLTDIGKKIVHRMKELGMLIDICHCTPKARQDVYEIVGDDASRVLASHTGAFSINPDPYNLEDWEIKWLADHGGILGIIFMNYWISPTDTGLGLKHIERMIDHLINVGGHEIIAIGTDFDGFTDPPDEITDISELPRLTRYLSCFKSGIHTDKYSPDVIKDILGRNSLRFILEGWKK
jgi:microsomal dipeptidase-like Zn-dependent dipeptidase